MIVETVTLTSDSPETTKQIAAAIAQFAPPGTVFALHGDLGAGKTCFVQGLARAVAEERDVHSPTFTIVNEYGKGPALYHVDLYRLDSIAEVEDLALDDLFQSNAIVAIEWAERAGGLLPEKRVEVRLQHADAGRAMQIDDRGALREGWQDAIRT
jgi:tRNA threonylcarbamoyladenosine biosynthesis protein TsaE